MTPERREIINGKKVEEYFWGRKTVVYVDNHAIQESFESACAILRRGDQPTWEGGLSPDMLRRGYK